MRNRRHCVSRTEPTTSNLIAEAELAERPPRWGIRRDALGIHAIAPVEYQIREGESSTRIMGRSASLSLNE